MGKQRFKSVWDALPSGLCDLMPLTSGALIEQALFDAAHELAKQKGFHLVRTVNGYRLTGHGMTRHYSGLSDAAELVRKLIESTYGPLAGADDACTPASTENATRAIYGAVSIASINWTDNTENATCACCMESVRQSNE
jgi:hypothetical protein